MTQTTKLLCVVSLLIMFTLIACNDNAVSSQSPAIDYFPLKLGNQWTYAIRKYTNHAGQDYSWTNGTETWRIVSADTAGHSKTYTVQENVNAAYIRYTNIPPISRWDTIVYTNATFTFTITEDSSSRLTFAFRSDSTDESPSAWIGHVVAILQLKRAFETNAESDLLHAFSSFEDQYHIVMDSALVAKSTGLKYIYYYSPGGGNYRWTYVDSLISCQLN